MKFSVLIAERFKKILFLSLIAAITGLIVYGLAWSIHARHRSKEFILSHLKEVIIAGVHSQSTFNIDGELNRVVDTWSKTQEFPLRADVYIDGKHWAHGGPMQPFGIFSISEGHSETLATGQKLTLDINMDLTGPVLRLLTALIIFIGFFILIYLSLRKGLLKTVEEISNPLEERVNRLSVASQNLSNHAKKGFVTQETQITELLNLDNSLNTLFNRINSLESEIAEQKYSEGQLQMAKQVTHALNGTLSAFSLYVDQTKSTDTIDRNFLNGIIQQIKSISSDLIESRKTDSGFTPDQNFNLFKSVDNVVEQKSKEITKLATKNIEIKLSGKQEQLLISGSKAKFELALINLITNSIEAIENKGAITIEIEQHSNRVTIQVNDDGCGIPSATLPLLMKEGATFGKENGHGLGLYHVKSIIEEIQGTISISSTEKFGTQIKIEVPLITEVSRTNEIVLFPKQQLIIVDDEKCIHDAWDILLKDFSDKIHITHLYSDSELENWIIKNSHDPFASRLFLFDYDLKSHTTGLNLIEKYQLMFESYLVTGMADDVEVIKESKKLKVKTIPKYELANLHLRFDENFFSSCKLSFLETT